MSSELRWDIHSERQVAASKGSATAITVLNSGSWLALLSQTSKLTDITISIPIFFWGLGALLGTSLWLFIYRGTLLSWEHECEPKDDKLRRKISQNIKQGVSCGLLALLSFAIGVCALTVALT